MMGHWSHQAFISLLKRVGLLSLQLNSDGLSPVFLISDFTDGHWLALYRCYGTVNSEGGWLRYHLAPPQYPAKEFAIHRLISSVAAGCVIGLRATITILFCYSEYPYIRIYIHPVLSCYLVCPSVMVATVYLSSGDWLSSIPHCSPTHNLVLVLQ